MPNSYLDCEVSRDEPSGAEIIARSGMMRNDAPAGSTTPGPWRTVFPNGQGPPGNPELDDVAPGRLWFSREVEVQPGGDYLVRVRDNVQVGSLERAERAWTLDLESVRRIATDGDFLEDPSSR